MKNTKPKEKANTPVWSYHRRTRLANAVYDKFAQGYNYEPSEDQLAAGILPLRKFHEGAANLHPVAVDFEVYYDKECTIKVLGVDGYLRHPKAYIYLVSVVGDIDAGEIFVGDPRDFDWNSLVGRDIWSHNAGSDRRVYHYLRIQTCWSDEGQTEWRYTMPDLETPRWRCTANLSVFNRAGRSLKAASKDLLGLEITKDVRDALKGLMPEDMKARPSLVPGQFPSLYEEACAYAVSDSTHCLWIALEYGPDWPELERRLSDLTIRACHRGLPLDVEALERGKSLLELRLWEIDQRLPWVTGVELPAECVDGITYPAIKIPGGKKPTSPKGLAEVCRAFGIPHPPSTTEDDPCCIVWEETYGTEYPWVADMRERRKANILLKRATSLLSGQNNGWFCYELKYFGAHTGRWSGGGER